MMPEPGGDDEWVWVREREITDLGVAVEIGDFTIRLAVPGCILRFLAAIRLWPFYRRER